ncbi:WD40-repeat-containing domain protein [Podospora aff. communis PSN243]|uniref:WD40-repeat-containing domain protein n=1 Tax=Podospora aff. communis PSN243 TaxID=3040156 RepID=A0AAV9GBC0_9PEZI|nr:WD40-repeat-containing domain protein [Podospora aff. communis PSN243]
MKLQLPERYLEPCTTTASIFLYARGSSVVCLPHDTKQMAWTFTKHSDQVQLIAVESKVDFIPQNLVVSYDASHTAIVWNLYNTGWEVPRLKFAEDEKINCLSWMRNGNVALGNVQGNVVVFDPAASQHVSIPTIDQLAITALAPADDCKTFAIGYQNGKLILATLQPRFTILHSLSTPIHLQAPSSSPVITLEWHGSPSRQKSDFLAVQADDGYLHVWSVPKARIPDSEEPARLVRFLKRPGRENYQPGRNWMSWSKGGRIIQYSNGETISWDVRTKNVTYDMIPMSRDVRGLAVYGPGAILFTLGPNHTVQKFDLNTPARFVNQIQHVSPTSSSGAQDQ